VQATYALEGAGCCVLEVSHWFRRLASFWRTFEPSLSFLNVRERVAELHCTEAWSQARGHWSLRTSD
jgi:hypothetical protein